MAIYFVSGKIVACLNQRNHTRRHFELIVNARLVGSQKTYDEVIRGQIKQILNLENDDRLEIECLNLIFNP